MSPIDLTESPPPWLAPGVRVRKAGSWPRVGILDGSEGIVMSLDIFEGRLRWFRVKWDNHADYPHGVDHYGWHAAKGNVVPIGIGDTHATKRIKTP